MTIIKASHIPDRHKTAVISYWDKLVTVAGRVSSAMTLTTALREYQSVYAVSGTSRCLFSDKYKFINTVWAERAVVES